MSKHSTRGSKHFAGNILMLVAAMAMMIAFLFVLPPDPKASEYENRSMASAPQLSWGAFVSGGYFPDLEAYLSDRIHRRTAFLSFTSSLNNAYGLQRGGSKMVVLDGDGLGIGLMPLEPDDPEDFPFEYGAEVFGEIDGTDAPLPSPPPKQRVNPDKPFGMDIHYDSDAVLFHGFYYNETTVARYAEVLNSYRESLPDSVRVFSLLAPIAVEWLETKEGSSPQDSSIQNIYNLLDENIITVDAYSKIAPQAEAGDYIFFRTDHHWTTLGAYYAYLAFAQEAGFDPVTIDNYVERSLSGFIGSLATGASRNIVENNPDTLYYYQLDTGATFSRKLFHIPEDISNIGYRIFLGGDYAKLDFASSNKNGKTLVVIKESYANAFVPWVAPNYERIIVIDPRQYTESVTTMVEGLNDVDFLFLNYVHATSLASFIETIADAI